jgi:peptide-methionine (S)-S-oxide reductase
MAQDPGAAARDTAVFAGGCFWCMEPPFDEMEGVLATVSGYAGGHVPDPTYEQVVAGGTGHREAVMVVFDPSRVGYARLLQAFWRNVDPLDDGGQFCDRGFSYTTAIFARSEEQARLATASRDAVQDRFDGDVVTPVVRDAPFYPAEPEHQNYYREKPLRYKYYRWSCGRDDRLDELWGARSPGGLIPPGRTS